jgi:hypothetical protein
MENRNPAMKKGGLKGGFPSGSGGSVQNGLSSRESMGKDPEAVGMGNTNGPNQLPNGPDKSKAKGPFSFA